MKQLTVVSGAVLAIIILASLAACSGGTFNDPGHEASGFTGSGGSTGSKPARLSSNASYDEALAKCDEIIAYCEAHTGQVNDAVKASARQTKGNMSLMGGNSYWSSTKDTWIDTINYYISSLQ
jgi:hypothetical protein